MNNFTPAQEQLDRILYHASLAPSPHNVQGWKFRPHGQSLDILADSAYRIMKELDPHEKERDIALGAVIENIVLAAWKEELQATVHVLPHGPLHSVTATVEFAPLDYAADEQGRGLHRWLEARGMNRSLYSRRAIPPEQLAELNAIAREAGLELYVTSDRSRIRQFATLAGTAGQFKFTHAPTHRELYRYLRFSRAQAAAHRDGLPIEHFNIPTWLGRIARLGMKWPVVDGLNRLGYHRALAWVQESLPILSAPAICLLRSTGAERIDYLQGGRVLQRLWLTAAKYGMAVQPHSAVADLSYARLAGYHDSISPAWRQQIDTFPQQLGEIFGIDDELHVINLFRVGYPTRSWKTRSLRRPVNIQYTTDTSEADRFYGTFTERNTPFISMADQQLLRRARLGIAGCGSIGGSAVEVLARMGAEHFLLAEPDVFELNNLNRQNATVADLGQHKATSILRRVQQINPHIQAQVLSDGLTTENLAYFVSSSAVIIDGVDVTTPSAIRIKVALHDEAHRQQKTVICGYDIAGTQLLRIYDYNNGRRKPLNGRFVKTDLSSLTSLGFLCRVVSPLDLPIEMLPVTKGIIAGTQDSIPQLGPTAYLFGVLSAWAALDAIAGRPLRHKVLIDIPDLLRPRSVRLKQTLVRLVGIIRLKFFLDRTLRKAVKAERMAGAGGVSS